MKGNESPRGNVASYIPSVSNRIIIVQYIDHRYHYCIVTEQACLFRAYGTGSALESVALKAAMVMPVLLLQRPLLNRRIKIVFVILTII